MIEKTSRELKLDHLDLEIVRLLQENGKLNNKELSSKIGLTLTPTYERVKRLERSGVIKRYTAIVDYGLLGEGVEVICHVSLKEHNQEFIQEFEERVVDFEEVVSCYHLAGDYDYALFVRVRGMETYYDFLRGKLASIEHISNVQSAFVMNRVKEY